MALDMARRPNPAVFGVELVDAAALTAGLSGTALANDKIIAPLIDTFIPSLKAKKTLRKIVDGATTLATAGGYDLVVGKLFRAREWGKWGQLGGTGLGIARFVSAVIPGYQISSVTPIDAEVGNLFNPIHPANQMAKAQATAALNAASPTNTATTTYVQPQGTASTIPGGLY